MSNVQKQLRLDIITAAGLFCSALGIGCQSPHAAQSNPVAVRIDPSLRRSASSRTDQLIQLTAETLKFARELRNESGDEAAAQAYLIAAEAVLHNLANAETIGFKRNQIQMEDLLKQANPWSSDASASQSQDANDSHSFLSRIFLQGDLIQTGERLDLAIQGEGMFGVRMPDGTMAYTRGGDFVAAADGQIMNSQGMLLCNGLIPLPQGTTSIEVTSNGVATSKGVSGIQVAQILLCRFEKPEHLKPIGSNLFGATDLSGSPIWGYPSENGFGLILQGYLEGSNVHVVEEMVELMRIQRAFQSSFPLPAAWQGAQVDLEK